MAYPGDANANLYFDLFHLLRSEQPNENILFSPLNISTALHLLYSCRGDWAEQAEMPTDFNQDNQDLHSRSEPDLEESPNYYALEASQRWDSMHKQRAQEALPKSLEEDCEVRETKEKPSIASPLPAFERDARQDGSNLTHALPSSVGHSVSSESVSSQYLLWRKLIPNHRAVEDFSREEVPPEMEASKELASGLENPKESVTQSNMAVGGVRLPSFYNVQGPARSRPSALFQPSRFTAYEGIYNNTLTKLGTSSQMFLPNSQPSRYTAYEGIYNNTLAKLGTSSQMFLPTSQPSKYTTYEGIYNNPLTKLGTSSQMFLPSSQPSKYTAYEGIYNNALTKLGTSSQMFLPTSQPSKYTAYERICNNTLSKLGTSQAFLPAPELDNRQLITGRHYFKTTSGTPLMFYTKDESLLRTDNENDLPSQEQSSLEETLEPQQGSPLGNLEKLSIIENIVPSEKFLISPVSSMETGAGHMQKSEVQENSHHVDYMENEDSETEFSPPFATDYHEPEWCNTSVQIPEDTINQKTSEDLSGEEGTSNQIASSNAWSTDRLISSTGDQRVAYSSSPPISMSQYFSYDLPWYKYLRGREKRETVVEFFHFMKQHEFENIMAPLESRRYKRWA
ncbi:uncharacterized protein LOC107983213 [Anolis carolinensis]|uniref:uncharacterized protein LOC107983213 n=1 Tax=Anolis carolinensis TaxID=28377 RepID=UPI002F2B7361